MIEHNLKLNIVKRGTHYVALGEINNDIPTPASIVAEYLSMLEYRISVIIEAGGVMNLNEAFQDLKNLNSALMDAKEQGWKLELAPVFVPDRENGEE